MLIQKVAFALKTYISPINTSTSNTQSKTGSDPKAFVPQKKKKENTPENSPEVLENKEESDPQKNPIDENNLKQNEEGSSQNESTENPQELAEHNTSKTPKKGLQQGLTSLFYLFQNMKNNSKKASKNYLDSPEKKSIGVKKGAIIDHKVE